jgi:hypothetical protein
MVPSSGDSPGEVGPLTSLPPNPRLPYGKRGLFVQIVLCSVFQFFESGAEESIDLDDEFQWVEVLVLVNVVVCGFVLVS